MDTNTTRCHMYQRAPPLQANQHQQEIRRKKEGKTKKKKKKKLLAPTNVPQVQCSATHTTTSRSQPTDLFPRVARPPQRSPPQAGYFRTLRGTQSRKPHFLQSTQPSLPKTRIPAPLPSWAPSPFPLCTSAPSRAPRLCNEGWGGGSRPKKHGRLPGMDKIKNKKKKVKSRAKRGEYVNWGCSFIVQWRLEIVPRTRGKRRNYPG